ncbi:RNA-binding domain-containing protein [Faucicola atlantae]|uniref:Schlafen AlbA-2 domain-containing protein n=1 Tax=Faucicola atlantae TaxID=34059 RepID=A0A1B8QGM3_9GAMM|nr:RNA-binding domain-containing protein [Moraxella atlantae]OBX81204.1 hypothetical protein A9306_06630 [Moraxella atlantae]
MISKDKILELWNRLLEQNVEIDIEAKRIKDKVGDSVMQTICAFSNSGTGYLILGVSEKDESHDDFWVSGVTNAEDIFSNIQNNCRSQFTTSINIDGGIATIEGKKVLVIEVRELDKSAKPCGFISGSNKKNYSKTGVWLRGINGDYEATVEELQPLIMAKLGHDYEQTILPSATMDDIDPKHIERYRRLRKEIKPNASELEYSDTELLLALDVATEKEGIIYPNVAGILLFGSDKALRRLMPSARVDYIRNAGTVWVEDIDKRFQYTNDLREAIITMIPKLEATVIDDLPKHFNLPPNSLTRADTPLLPQAVVREAIVNMLMHRDYSVNRPSQINRFSDRIEFSNAGYSLKPIEKILEGQKGSELRNPIIAQVLYDLTLAETKGSGITIMNRGLKNAGLSPVIFKSNRAYNDCETVLRLQQLIAEEEMLWLKQFDSLTDTEAEVLILAKKMGQITNKDIRENVGLDTLQASSILRKFCKNNYLLQHGKSSNSYYLLNSCYVDNSDSLSEKNSNTGNNEPRHSNNDLSTGINEPSTSINEPSTSINERSTSINDVIIIKEVADLSNAMLLNLQSIVAFARAKGRFTPEQSKSIVLQICQKQFMSSSILKHFLNREVDTIRRNYLSPLLKEGLLELAYPKTLQHPNQAYRTTEKGLAYLEILDNDPQQDLLI